MEKNEKLDINEQVILNFSQFFPQKIIFRKKHLGGKIVLWRGVREKKSQHKCVKLCLNIEKFT